MMHNGACIIDGTEYTPIKCLKEETDTALDDNVLRVFKKEHLEVYFLRRVSQSAILPVDYYHSRNHWKSAVRNWVLSKRTLDESHDSWQGIWPQKGSGSWYKARKEAASRFLCLRFCPKASKTAAWSEKWGYINLSQISYHKIQSWSHTRWFRPYIRHKWSPSVLEFDLC